MFKTKDKEVYFHLVTGLFVLVTLSLDQSLCPWLLCLWTSIFVMVTLPLVTLLPVTEIQSHRERERQKRGAMREREKKKRQRMRDKERIKGEGEGERKNQCLQEKIFPPRFHKKAQK
jgi:hypothetical protein